MTLAELAGLIAAAGTLTGFIIFLYTRKTTNDSTVASITKTNKEVEQIEQEIESKYAIQVKAWLEDLEEIKHKHDIAIQEKTLDMTELHRQYLIAIKDISEQKLRLDRFNKAARRIHVHMDTPYWECDGSGALVYVNGAWSNLFGISPLEAVGKGWAMTTPEEEREAITVEWDARVVDQIETDFEFNIENPLTGKKSRVKALYAIVHDSEDEIFKIIGVTVEI